MTRFRTFTMAAGASALALALSACVSANEGSLNDRERWTGQPADAFFAQYGSPFAEYGQQNGGVRYTWRKRYAVATGEGGSSVRVCEIDLLTDASDTIRQIVPTRNSKIRADETASCEGVLDINGV